MSESVSIEAYRRQLEQQGIATREQALLGATPLLEVAVEDWSAVARVAAEQGLRWCGLWGQQWTGDQFGLDCLLYAAGQYLMLRCRFEAGQQPGSQAPYFAAADRLERHAHDLLGIDFAEQPDSRRWTRHRAWAKDEFPLRDDFAADQLPETPTPPDFHYLFNGAQGAGIVEIPVGPVHAGIIEPGHFRFQAVGETVINLEQHLGYVHKGIERIAVGRDAEGLARLAGRVSGDSAVAHAWAACMAMEQAAGCEVPPRALYLRALMAERERVANHLGDIGAICNDVGFAFAQMQLTRLRELFLRDNGLVFGHRLLMDRVLPGGVLRDINDEQAWAMSQTAHRLAQEVDEIIERLEDSESLEDRLMTTGRLTPDQAVMLGATGYVGKASGQAFDVRHDAPYAPYGEFELRVPSYRAGDVAARAKIRAEEISVSLWLIGQLLSRMPGGELRAECALPANAEGIGLVDGWRGEIAAYVRSDAEGRVARYFPRDPSWHIWPALELLVQGNIVPDFPVCNKSVNGSYSGHDL